VRLAEIWRYPVKTMAGEQLPRATLGELGIAGDRQLRVVTPAGRVITSRSHPRFLAHRGSLGPAGEVLVDQRPWDSPEVSREVAEIAGAGARLLPAEGAERFDILPLLIATDGAIAAFGHDARRLRPNLILSGVPGMAERDWPGSQLRIGPVRIGIQSHRLRCIMTSYDPDTQEQDKEITRGIYERFEGKLALDCFVIHSGSIAVGDEVELERGEA